MFKKILVANRGEIAVRIFRTCREMGIGTVAIYSEADVEARHVKSADEAYCVGPAPAIESYLAAEKIIQVAKEAGVEAIHPGYGFLSENAAFAQLCKDSGLVFVGPSPQAIEQMGDKLVARKLMRQAGVPIVPGTEVLVHEAAEVQQVAAEIGYPVMLKATAGGGGRGMRLISCAEDVNSALETARKEAHAAFRDGSVYVEKYFVHKPRHIEVQLLADNYGNVIHLNERECSIQRRYQKLIEESPSKVVDPELRARMGQAAIDAAKAVNYSGAGTVEFLVDGDFNFYFLEMNTRLQVEHPVTEMITGLDLVREQINIAAGEKLSLRQEDVTINGWAIECRIYAENPKLNFFPSPGTITRLQPPAGEGIREDSGVYEGAQISVYYDPLMSKLIAWGQSREQAAARMREALDNYIIEGIATTIPFEKLVMRDDHFICGDFDIRYIDVKMPQFKKQL